jgi:hypothetical protein
MSTMSDLFQAAHDAYLAEHSEPQNLDFTCPRCKAEPGQPCWWPGRQRPGRIDFRDLLNPKYHVGRQQLRAKAANQGILAAIHAGEAAEHKAHRS